MFLFGVPTIAAVAAAVVFVTGAAAGRPIRLDGILAVLLSTVGCVLVAAVSDRWLLGHGAGLRSGAMSLDAFRTVLGIVSAEGPLFCGLALAFWLDDRAFILPGFLLTAFGLAYWSWRERMFLFESTSQRRPQG